MHPYDTKSPITPAILFIDVVNKIIYVSEGRIIVPDGWTWFTVPQMTPVLKAAVHLRNCGFMSVEAKIRGIKMVRAVSGADLVSAKNAWEIVWGMDSTLFAEVMHQLYS